MTKSSKSFWVISAHLCFLFIKLFIANCEFPVNRMHQKISNSLFFLFKPSVYLQWHLVTFASAQSPSANKRTLFGEFFYWDSYHNLLRKLGFYHSRNMTFSNYILSGQMIYYGSNNLYFTVRFGRTDRMFFLSKSKN